MYYLDLRYTKKVIIIFLKFEFNWVSQMVKEGLLGQVIFALRAGEGVSMEWRPQE